MASQHADKWKQAKDREVGRLQENDVYDLISRAAMPFDHKVIGTRWIYKVKSNCTVKARLVVPGWSQRPGIGCGATFAPVCRIKRQRLLLAIYTRRDWDTHKLYIKNGFFQSEFDEEVLVNPAPGYGILEATTGIPMVIKV